MKDEKVKRGSYRLMIKVASPRAKIAWVTWATSCLVSRDIALFFPSREGRGKREPKNR